METVHHVIVKGKFCVHWTKTGLDMGSLPVWNPYAVPDKWFGEMSFKTDYIWEPLSEDHLYQIWWRFDKVCDCWKRSGFWLNPIWRLHKFGRHDVSCPILRISQDRHNYLYKSISRPVWRLLRTKAFANWKGKKKHLWGLAWQSSIANLVKLGKT